LNEQENGGKVAGSLTKVVTHCISSDIGSEKTTAAVSRGLPVVNENWLDASIADGKLSTKDEYFVSKAGADDDGGNDNGGDDDEDDEPKKKKVKATPKRSVAKPKKKSKGDDDDDEEDGNDDGKKSDADGDDDDDDDDDKKKKSTSKAASKSGKSGGESDGGQRKKVLIKGRAAVDQRSGKATDHHVLEEGDVVFGSPPSISFTHSFALQYPDC
jgi:hypothetical protein